MPKKILLADDSVTIQKVVELTFMEGDYEVTCVSNGKAAVQKIQEARPDILLCDVIMPEMNGYDVASFVKKNPAFSSIPVILLTGTFEPFDEEKARNSGAETYITKPFDSRLLVEKVEELISRRMVLDISAASAPAQVTHSLQEFTIQAAPAVSAAPPPPPPPEPVEEEKPFLTPELEFSMPVETAPPPEQIPAVHAAQVPVKEAPSIHEELLGAPVDGSEAFVAGDVMEALDVGPISPEDAIPDTVFEGVLSPPTAVHGEPGEVVLPAGETEAFPAVSADAAEPFAGEALTLKETGALSVGGAEDWGLSKPFEEVEVSPEAAGNQEKLGGLIFDTGSREMPQIVHEMTEQQEMVSEAQSFLEQEKQQAPVAPPPAEEAFSEEAILSRVEELASPPEPVTDAFEISDVPPLEQHPAEAHVALEESPFLPEEGVETGLPEIPSEAEALHTPVPVEAEATAEAPMLLSVPVPSLPVEEAPLAEEMAEPIPAELEAEPEPVPLPEEPPVETAAQIPEEAVWTAPVEEPAGPVSMEEVVPEAVELEPPAVVGIPLEETLPEPPPEASAEELPPVPPAPVEEAVIPVEEPIPLVEEPVAPAEERIAPVEEAIAPEEEPAEPVKVVFDREELANMVRMVVEDLAPHLIRQVVNETAPEVVRQVVNQVAPDAVRLVAQDLVHSEVRRAVEEVVPAEARRVTGELLPGTVEKAIDEVLPGAVTKSAAEVTPSVAGEVVGRLAPDIIRQVAEGMAPAAVAENVKRMTAEIVAEEVRQAAAETVRQVAWEVIPELAESLIKRRIQELESEVG